MICKTQIYEQLETWVGGAKSNNHNMGFQTENMNKGFTNMKIQNSQTWIYMNLKT